jgi:hypothetical protein
MLGVTDVSVVLKLTLDNIPGVTDVSALSTVTRKN